MGEGWGRRIGRGEGEEKWERNSGGEEEGMGKDEEERQG